MLDFAPSRAGSALPKPKPGPPHHLRAHAVPESIASLRDSAARAALAAGCSHDVASSVRLAVSEAATNAVLHAYAPDRPGEVEVAVDVDGDALVVEVRDEGWGMRPRNDSPGAGLGLPIVRRIATDVRILPARTGGTSVRMRFPLCSAARTA